MPDPLLYLQTSLLVASASALVVLALAWRGTPASAMLINGACLAGILCGQAVGCYWLPLLVSWPPASSLDRYLLIVLPAALGIELIAAVPMVPKWGALFMRCLLAACLGRVLLHGSVHLAEWTLPQTIATLSICALLPMLVWWGLLRLNERSPGISLPLAITLAIQGAGIAIMLAGYLKGGAAAMIGAAALLGAGLGGARVARRVPLQSLIGLGVVSLSSLLMIGVFFGRLPSASALLLLATPLLCWLTELPWLKTLSPPTIGTLRIALVATVIASVLLVAKQKFERDFRPLLMRADATASQSLAAAVHLPPQPSSRLN